MVRVLFRLVFRPDCECLVRGDRFGSDRGPGEHPTVEPERAYDRQTIMQPNTWGRAFIIAFIIAGALGGSGCGTGWQDQPISRVSVSGDGRSLDVGWNCHQDADVEVEESQDEVRLRLRVSSYKGDCADVERATLSSALGDRQVVDSTTGKTIPPCLASDAGAVGTVNAPDCQ